MNSEDYFGNLRKSAEEELFSIIENSLCSTIKHDVLFVYVRQRATADTEIPYLNSYGVRVFSSFTPVTADIFVSISGRFDHYLDYMKFEGIKAPKTIAYCHATQHLEFPINMGAIRDEKILMSM